MKYRIELKSVQRRLPEGYSLPSCFLQFVGQCQKTTRGTFGYFSISYSDPAVFVQTKSEPEKQRARNEVIPFFSLSDGGVVSLWFKTLKSPAVVWLGSEGQQKVIAASPADFLYRLSKRTTSVPDLDDAEFDEFPRLRGVRKVPAALSSLTKAFSKWCSPDDHGLYRAEGVADVANKLFSILKPLMGPDDFGRELVVDLTPRRYRVSWYDGGQVDFPDPESVREPLESLRRLLGRDFKQTEISISNDGKLYVDGDLCALK